MKKTVCRTLSCILILAMLVASVSCASGGKTILTLKENGKTYTVSLNTYTLLLSRVKGMLSSYGYSVDEDAFWDYPAGFDANSDATRAEYFESNILESCKLYLAALALFDTYGLSLSESEEKTIEQDMEELLRTDGDGSKAKLNSVLSDFGVNADQLKEIYVMETKLSVLKSHLLSVATADVKQQFLADNYVHYWDVTLSYYDYVYETDTNGDLVYYTDEAATKIAYDTVGGVLSGKTDANGDAVYCYSGSERICYDKDNGVKVRATDSSGNYQTAKKSATEMAELKNTAAEYLAELTGCDDATFQTAVQTKSIPGDTGSNYSDGYYLEKDLDFASMGDEYQYLSKIVAKLNEMEVGDVAVVDTDSGIHIIRKYAPTTGAYSLSANTALMENFEDSLGEELLNTYCAKLSANAVLNEKNFAKAPKIKSLPVNYYY